MLTFKTKADLQRLVDEAVEESITLDYKASPALARTSEAINELCKDVSAMANATGGQIVYGIEENKVTRKPERVDDGVSDPKITREWIVGILNSRVHPRINGVRVEHVRLNTAPDAFGFVISIEPTQIGPHQAPDHRYYKRFELHSVPMEDYEVRGNIMRRSTTPNLYLKLQLRTGHAQTLRFTSGDGKSDPIPLVFSVGNRSSQPATHVIVTIGLDSRLTISSTGDYEGPLPRKSPELNYLRLLIRPPEWLPVFKEAQEDRTFNA